MLLFIQLKTYLPYLNILIIYNMDLQAIEKLLPICFKENRNHDLPYAKYYFKKRDWDSLYDLIASSITMLEYMEDIFDNTQHVNLNVLANLYLLQTYVSELKG